MQPRSQQTSPRAPIRVALADDHALFRQGLRALLKPCAGVRLVDEVERLEDIGPMLARSPCEVLLLDLELLSDGDALDRLAKQVAVVALSEGTGPEDGLAAVRAGARAVVSKGMPLEMLLEAISAVGDGQVWLPPGLQAQLVASWDDLPGERLSTREREVVRYVALGWRNAEVAAQLSISENTVKKHLNTVFQKLAIRDRAELVLRAIQLGIIPAPSCRRAALRPTKVAG